jgi:hypothetical protein
MTSWNNIIEISKNWVMQRFNERTSWDGVVLVVAGVVYLIFKPIASLVAYGAIAYGIWTIWKGEK